LATSSQTEHGAVAVPIRTPAPSTVASLLTEHFRCDGDLAEFVCPRNLEGENGYFRFGRDVVCYGQCSSGVSASYPSEILHDAASQIAVEGAAVRLPFDPVQTVENLLYERYRPRLGDLSGCSYAVMQRKVYYHIRPLLGTRLRRKLQKSYFRHWREIPFPQWPVDITVDSLLEKLLMLSMRARNVHKLPFIWFWPRGMPSCTMMTHDVETAIGRDFCGRLMDLDDSFGIKAAFQIVPEKRYAVTSTFLQNIRKRGFEINIHDLNHDGYTWSEKNEFMRRAERINFYGREFGADGFRSAVMYRNPDWYDALDFSYDMSIPNVAHLEPQQGGCCAVRPFFIGNILELPLTTTQDYSLFHIIGDYSIGLWREQIARIRGKHGLISFIVHPDYVIDLPAQRVYRDLLTYLSAMRDRGETWLACPSEIAAWWRLRSRMKLTCVEGEWRVEGEGSRDAKVAFATVRNSGLSYEIPR
jgi:hypothetical protein